jgi:hypothetical protein
MQSHSTNTPRPAPPSRPQSRAVAGAQSTSTGREALPTPNTRAPLSLPPPPAPPRHRTILSRVQWPREGHTPRRGRVQGRREKGPCNTLARGGCVTSAVVHQGGSLPTAGNRSLGGNGRQGCCPRGIQPILRIGYPTGRHGTSACRTPERCRAWLLPPQQTAAACASTAAACP